jgi:hypothetical protein
MTIGVVLVVVVFFIFLDEIFIIYFSQNKSKRLTKTKAKMADGCIIVVVVFLLLLQNAQTIIYLSKQIDANRIEVHELNTRVMFMEKEMESVSRIINKESAMEPKQHNYELYLDERI